MSAGFTKLFSSITQSTVWQEPDHVRILWITMLALADQRGQVMASVPGLAHTARVDLAKTKEALDVLMAPDAYSRTKDNEGRRIEEIDGGWQLLNHGKYRAKLSAEDRRQYKADKQRQYRARDAAAKASTEDGVDDGGQKRTELTQAEAEAEADAKAPEQSAPAEQKPASRAKARAGTKLTFDQFIEDAKARGLQAITREHEAFQIADNAGMPSDYVRLCWYVFRQSHEGRTDKKQLDWRKAFANYVRHNYFKLWRTSQDGFELTSTGVQSMREMKGATDAK